MKKLLTMALAGIALVGLTGCGSKDIPETNTEGKITVLTNSGYAPYETMTTSGELEGFDVDLMNTIASNLKMEIEWKDIDFDSLITAVNSGQGDIVAAGLSPTPKRAEAAELSEVYYKGDEETVNYVLCKKDSGINTTADITGKKVGVQIGTIQEETVTEIAEDYKLTLDNRKGYTDMVQEIMNGRMDFVVMEKAVADEYIALHEGLQVFKLEAGGDSAGNALAMKKGNTKLKEKIDAEIKAMQDSGEMQTLIEKWFTE